MTHTDAHFYRPGEGTGLPHGPFNAIIGPRPIGWISSHDVKGTRNLAPCSVFNGFNYGPASIFRFELETGGADPGTLDAEVMIGVFAVEGLLSHPLDDDEQRAICDVLVARWD